MSGDYSKDSFDALRNFAGVFLQQGRAVLDSDWNEMVEMFERRIRASTVDTIGRAVVPRETPLAFELQPTDGSFGIGRGRFYLDGLVCENFGNADFSGADSTRPDPVFDRGRAGASGPEGVLDEMISPEEGDFVDYFDQPYWPTATPLPDDGTHLAYLVAWNRAVTATEMPGLLEPALGGFDTTTRWQTVWQVRVLANVGNGVTCSSPDQDLNGWTEEAAPSTARLTNGTIEVEDVEDPCLVPPTEGYTGVENQFYRVEIHGAGPDAAGGAADGDTQGDWRFKFSRENASVRASVTAMSEDGQSLNVGSLGRDEVLRFAPGDWVELTDDRREFDHLSGQMLRVVDVDPETRQIEFETSISAGLVPGGDDDTLASRHTRLIRWDQRGVIRLDDNSEWVDLDAAGSDGLIPVPPDGRAIVLENGITVQFSTADGPGRYRAMDHWRFAARTAGTQIEPVIDAPPDGVQRHYARLAIATGDGLSDCRIFWPPAFEAGGEGCSCTVCVSAEEHNSGNQTIQEAINQVGASGGTVCLEAGAYLLQEPVQIANRVAIKLVGQGLGTFLIYQGEGGAVQVASSVDVQLERFTVLAAPGDDQNGPVHGVTAINTSLLAARRLAVVIAAPETDDRLEFALALDGVQIGTKIEECLLVGPVALGSRSTFGADNDGDLQFVAFAELRVLDSILFAREAAIRFGRSALNISAALLSRNLMWSLNRGISVNFAEIPAGSLSIETSSVVANGTALRVSSGTLRVQDCEISAGDDGGHGIVLTENILPDTPTDAQLIGNSVFDLSGMGIRLEGQHATVLIKRNIVRNCGQAGIAMMPGASARHLAIDNNAIEDIGNDGASSFAVGIAVLAVESGQIVGNSVRDVGELGGNGQIYAGISIQGCVSVDISSNVISGIGGNQVESVSTGILATQPFLGLTVNANRVFGELDQSDDQVAWQAIRIGAAISGEDVTGVGSVTTGFLADTPGVAATEFVNFAIGDRMWTAAPTRIGSFQPALPAQVTCRGNQCRSSQSLVTTMVSAVVPGARAVGFADNQIDLQGRGGLFAVVALASPVLTVGGNTVSHTTDATSMRLFTGANGSAAAVGNLTTSGIQLNNGNLPAPFDALNLSI